MATAPSISIDSISSPSSSAPPKSIDLSSTNVTVGDPAETTIRYYTGTWAQQSTSTHMALELTTSTTGRLNSHIVSYGDSIAYNQRIGLRAEASNSAGLSATAQLQYANIYLLDDPDVTYTVTNNGDGTKTTVFTFTFDNGAAEARVRVAYSVANRKVDSWNASGWSSFAVSNQETIEIGATGTQTLHFSSTTPTGADYSYRFRLGANPTGSTDWSSGYTDFHRDIYYVPGFTTKIYGRGGSSAKEIISLYGPSNGQAQRVVKMYGSVNGRAKLIHQGFGYAE